MHEISKPYKYILVWCCLLIFTRFDAYAQEISYAAFDTTENALVSIPSKFYSKTEMHLDAINNRLIKQGKKILSSLSKTESDILNAVAKADNISTGEITRSSEAKYAELVEKLKKPGYRTTQYVPLLDSINVVFKFHELHHINEGKIPALKNKLSELKSRFGVTQEIQTLAVNRQQELKQLLQSYKQFPARIAEKYLKKYSSQTSYYTHQVREYKSDLNSPDKYEELVLTELSKLPEFKSFMQENGEMASLFGSPSNAVVNLPALQTRAGLMQTLQQRGFDLSGTGGLSFVQKQMQSAQSLLNSQKKQLDKLRNGEFGKGNSELSPTQNFNTQKGKSFLKRIEYGVDFQSGIKQYQFPASNALGISAGYKWNDRFSSGIGLAYKFGLGKNFKEFHYTSDGIELRSFIDFKLSSPQGGPKVLFGNIWLYAGYEKNYCASFKNVSQLKSLCWQESGLAGISKRLQVNSKRERFMSMQALWDFLSYRQLPKSQPFVFRIRYSI